MYYICIYVGSCDCNSINEAAIIGAIVGVMFIIIIIMVITNIMVWIYCFRRRQHTGTYMVCESVKCFTKKFTKILHSKFSIPLHSHASMRLAKDHLLKLLILSEDYY